MEATESKKQSKLRKQILLVLTFLTTLLVLCEVPKLFIEPSW